MTRNHFQFSLEQLLLKATSESLAIITILIRGKVGPVMLYSYLFSY